MIEIKHRFTGAVLRTVDADTLRHAILTDADLTGANLYGANLRNADLTGAILSGAILSDANLRNADLTGADLSGAILSDADLTNANLRNANLTNANLAGAILSDADLTNANLRNANLTNANLAGAILTNANLTNANLEGTILPGFDAQNIISLTDAASATREWLKAGHWITRAWIKTPTGAYAGDCLACLHGAARYVGGPVYGPALSDTLIEAGYTVEWNDAPDRTLPEVLAALDAVAKNEETPANNAP